ncbi:MAG: hypothetical protein LC769_13525, partial [Chloroflexi bacterium]|nr:hypothetical protein [Chloroflexota bacterium]
FLAVGAICVALAAVSHSASAAGGKALDGSYFFGSCTDCVQDTATIAGQTFRGTDIIMLTEDTGEQISLNARKLPGYTAVTFQLGCEDKDSGVGARVVLQVLGDGQTRLGTYMVTQGQPARQVIVPFKGHGTISFVTGPAEDVSHQRACEVTLATPLAIVLAGPGSTVAPALTVAPARVAAGAQETLSAVAPAGTQASAVVTYASGQQQIAGPTLVGTNGRVTLTFTVAQGASGTARVTFVTATKVLAATFTVTT